MSAFAAAFAVYSKSTECCEIEPMYRFLMIRPDEAFVHPFHWAAKQLAFYFGAAAVAAAGFVATAAIHSYLVPLPIPAPSALSAPVIAQPVPQISPSRVPATTAPPSQTPDRVDPSSIVSWKEIPFKEALGARVVDPKGTHLGRITDMSVTTSGFATVTIEKPNGASVKVPANSLSWSGSANVKVEAVVKPTIDYKALFGG
jgi:hypothetical protein